MRDVHLCFLLFAVMFLSCKYEEEVFFDVKIFNNGIWDVSDTLVFRIEFPDTLASYNLYYFLRIKGDYPYSNFFIFLLHKPYGDTLWRKDTVELILADNYGRWLGTVRNNVVENLILFRKDYKIKKEKRFIVKVVHGMREVQLNNVLAFGIKICKTLK